MKTNLITILGYSISYFEVNPEETTTLVFIHGNSMSKQLFLNQLNSAEFSNYRMISFDLIGFGESSTSTQPVNEYNVTFYAELVNALIQALNLENVYLIGHSLGGHIAIEFAGRYADKLKGFMAVGTPPLGIPADIPAAFLPNPAANLLFQANLCTEEVIDLSVNVANELHQKAVITSVQSADPLSRENIGASIIGQNYLDEIEVLDKTTLPYALVLGTADKFCNPNYFIKYPFYNQWRGTVNSIEQGSHNPFLDNPKEINQLILEFLAANN